MLELFHGTSEDERGDLSLRFTRCDVGSLVRLHLTDSLGIARFYAATRAWSQGGFGKRDPRGVVLAVRVKPADLKADLRAYRILNDERKKRGERPVQAPLVRDWEISLAEMGSVVHRGEIPSKDVAIVEYVRPARRVRIADDRPLVHSLAFS